MKSTQYKHYPHPYGEITLPLAVIDGKHPGKHFVITAGLHGTEYPGIAAAIRIFTELDPMKVHERISIIPIQSMEAFERRTMFVCPVDGKNPNRVFPGKRDGSNTEKLTYHLLHDIILQGDYHIDLHSGDMVETLVPLALYHAGAGDKTERLSAKSRLTMVWNISFGQRVKEAGRTPGHRMQMQHCAGSPVQ